MSAGKAHSPCDCRHCVLTREWRERWDEGLFGSIRRVLECHALGADVIALKDQKTERLSALHAMQSLNQIQRELVNLRTEVGP